MTDGKQSACNIPVHVLNLDLGEGGGVGFSATLKEVFGGRESSLLVHQISLPRPQPHSLQVCHNLQYHRNLEKIQQIQYSTHCIIQLRMLIIKEVFNNISTTHTWKKRDIKILHFRTSLLVEKMMINKHMQYKADGKIKSFDK